MNNQSLRQGKAEQPCLKITLFAQEKEISCLRWYLNPQHSVYQADALPTEPPRQLSWAGQIIKCYARANVSSLINRVTEPPRHPSMYWVVTTISHWDKAKQSKASMPAIVHMYLCICIIKHTTMKHLAFSVKVFQSFGWNALGSELELSQLVHTGFNDFTKRPIFLQSSVYHYMTLQEINKLNESLPLWWWCIVMWQCAGAEMVCKVML